MRKRRETGSPLKVIVMSATLSTGLFSEYFGCTVLSASGRTHPVTQVGATLCSIAPEQAAACLTSQTLYRRWQGNMPQRHDHICVTMLSCSFHFMQTVQPAIKSRDSDKYNHRCDYEQTKAFTSF